TGIEVTPDGFMAAIRDALVAKGAEVSECTTPEGIAAALEADPRPTVVIVDEYDRLRLLDQWIRRIFLPSQPERERWVFVGRLRPNTAWFTTPGWSDAVLSFELGLLDEAASTELLARRGVPTECMPPMLRLARGHPLALELSSRQQSLLSASVEGVGKE